MNIKLNDNVVFSIYDENKKMKEKILEFISDSKTNKILYKGDPNDINYKLLKKIIPIKNIKFDDKSNNINQFVKIDDSSNVKDIYNEFLNKIDCQYCLIYKIK